MKPITNESRLVPLRISQFLDSNPDAELRLTQAGISENILSLLKESPCSASIIAMHLPVIEKITGLDVQQMFFRETRETLNAEPEASRYLPAETIFTVFFQEIRDTAQVYTLARLQREFRNRQGISPGSWLRTDRVKFPATIYQLILLDHFMKTGEDLFPVAERPIKTNTPSVAQPKQRTGEVSHDRNQVVSHLIALRAIVSLTEANAVQMMITDGERIQILALIGRLLRVSQIDEAALKRLRSRIPADLSRQITHILTPPSGGKESL